MPCSPAHRRDGAHVRHRHRLAAAGVVRHREHAARNPLPAHLGDEGPERVHVHVALERVARLRLAALADHQVHRAARRCTRCWRAWCRSACCSAPRRPGLQSVEKRMRSAARPWCVGRTWRKPKMSLHRRLEAEPRPAPGVGLVAAHHRRPLLRAHRGGAAVGEEVDQDVLGADQEDVVVRPPRASARARRGW